MALDLNAIARLGIQVDPILSAKKFISPLYVSLVSDFWPRTMRTEGNFLILNFAQSSVSSSDANANFTVRLNTVSLDNAFQIVGAFFELVKRIIFGLMASDEMYVSASADVSFVD